jgi:hypothetical protein
MYKRYLTALWLAALLLVSGCSAILPDPLEKAEATMVPGVTAELHSPLANEKNTDSQTVTLFFRYGREPMLAGEARVLSVSQNESAEKALVQALLDGPGVGSTELNRLFPDQVQVLNTVAQGDVLFVTFNDALLKPYADEPNDWQSRDDWLREVPLRRRLAMAGLTASITENFSYHRVQVLVQQRSDVSTSLRLENAYFHDERNPSGLAAPFTREEALLLTQENTMRTIIEAWQEKDWSRLYLYVAAFDQLTGQPRPSMETAYLQWDQAPAVSGFDTTGGSVSPDGSRAVMSVDLTLVRGNGQEMKFSAYPVMLFRDRGIWKISYEQLTAMMDLIQGKEAAQ